jgi:nucleotide-binding universal stress UspA family protein
VDFAADLIVLGAQGQSVPGYSPLGSTAERVIEYGLCSVLVARPPIRELPLKVIVVVDGSPEADEAACYLCRLGLSHWAIATVLSVAEAADKPKLSVRPPVPGRSALARRVQLAAAEARAALAIERLRDCGVEARGIVRLGHPADEAVALARALTADLVVASAYGQHHAGRVPWSGVARRIIRHAPCSVLLVRTESRLP